MMGPVFHDTSEVLNTAIADCPLAIAVAGKTFDKPDLEYDKPIDPNTQEFPIEQRNYFDELGTPWKLEQLPDELGTPWEEEHFPDELGALLEREHITHKPETNPERSTHRIFALDGTDNPEKKTPIQNKIEGRRRETEVQKELEAKYPIEDGYKIIPEAYLRDKNGNIMKDPETGKARRVDFMVVKDGKVVESIEVTSKTADKSEQLAKEERIRDYGGNYILDENGNLIEIPEDVHTRVERRD